MSGVSTTVARADTGFFGWWREGTRDAKRALIAAALGWMLDAFDVMLYRAGAARRSSPTSA